MQHINQACIVQLDKEFHNLHSTCTPSTQNIFFVLSALILHFLLSLVLLFLWQNSEYHCCFQFLQFKASARVVKGQKIRQVGTASWWKLTTQWRQSLTMNSRHIITFLLSSLFKNATINTFTSTRAALPRTCCAAVHFPAPFSVCLTVRKSSIFCYKHYIYKMYGLFCLQETPKSDAVKRNIKPE